MKILSKIKEKCSKREKLVSREFNKKCSSKSFEIRGNEPRCKPQFTRINKEYYLLVNTLENIKHFS